MLDVNCKAHELDNLYVTDTSFFPSIGAVNPALTAMANAIRVGEHISRADRPEPENVLSERKETMKNGQSFTSSSFQLNATPMIVGAALIGAGCLIGLTGLIVGGTAMVSATRQWLRELEVPPS